MMNTVDIHCALSTNKWTRNYFQGVFALDKIPKVVKKKPAIFVFNTDPSNLPGTHWVAVHMTKNRSEFFDSFGRKPDGRVLTFLKNNSNSFSYNSQQLQSPFTSVCGFYCCLFLLYKSRRMSMKTFLKLFKNNNFLVNDCLVESKFKQLFKVHANKICRSSFIGSNLM